MTEPIQTLELKIERPATVNIGGYLATAEDLKLRPIEDGDRLALVREDLRDVSQVRKNIEARRVKTKEPALQMCRTIDELFAEMDAPWAQAEQLMKTGIADFDRRERLRIEDANRLAQEAARAEQRRLADEAAAAEQRAREEAERLATQAREQAAQGNVEAAATLETQAQVVAVTGAAEAQQLAQAAQTLPTASVAPAPTKESGVSYLYDFEIVAETAISREFLVPDHVKIRKTVKALKEQAEKLVGGIRVVKKASVRS